RTRASLLLDIRREEPLQMRLADGNHVIQQFATAAADPALGYTVLPRTTHCSPHRLDVHGANRDGHFGAVLGVVIQEEKLGRPLVGKGFAQWLHDPSAGRMAGHVEMENAPPIVANDKEAIKHTEGDGG